MGSTQNSIKVLFPSFIDDMINDVDHSGVSTAENQDDTLIRIEDEGLIVQEDILGRFPINLAEKSRVRFFKGGFSWHLSG